MARSNDVTIKDGIIQYNIHIDIKLASPAMSRTHLTEISYTEQLHRVSWEAGLDVSLSL